jgi:hypothetical protein
MAPHDRLRIYILRGRHTVLAWCRDSKNTWESELKNGEKPEVLKETKINLTPALGDRRIRSARIYDPWANRWSEAKVRHGEFTLPAFSRSIVIRMSVE